MIIYNLLINIYGTSAKSFTIEYKCTLRYLYAFLLAFVFVTRRDEGLQTTIVFEYPRLSLQGIPVSTFKSNNFE